MPFMLRPDRSQPLRSEPGSNRVHGTGVGVAVGVAVGTGVGVAVGGGVGVGRNVGVAV
jgi:hypothetical protein